MHNNPSNLIVAVSKALNRSLDKNRSDDRLLIQRGCYILNSWGYGPSYRYSLYIRGPYSSELADDYYDMRGLGNYTNIPDEAIRNLSAIMNKGIGFTEAYATVLMIKKDNPNRTNDEIYRKALDIKPRLKKEITEACSLILT